MEIKVVRNTHEANEVIASENNSLFAEKGIYMVNLMGSPGAGKTSLLERTVKHLKDGEREGLDTWFRWIEERAGRKDR